MQSRNYWILINACLFWILSITPSVFVQATTEDETFETLKQLQETPAIIGVQLKPFIDDHGTNEDQPKARDLRTKKLKKKLGRDFNEEWMSIQEPDEKIAPETTNVQETLSEQASMLNFSYTDQDGNEVRLDQNTVDVMKKWLVQKATCAVQHQWVDIGLLFWPRWIKHGKCAGQPCSWPPGMSCENGNVTEINLLRWYCKSKKKGPPPPVRPSRKKRGAKKKKNKCKWIKIPYPIISECVCTCNSRKTSKKSMSLLETLNDLKVNKDES